MPTIITKPVDELQKMYAELLDGYDEWIGQARELVDEISYGSDLTNEGQKVFDDLHNALDIVEHVGRFLPDLLPDNLFDE